MLLLLTCIIVIIKLLHVFKQYNCTYLNSIIAQLSQLQVSLLCPYLTSVTAVVQLSRLTGVSVVSVPDQCNCCGTAKSTDRRLCCVRT